MTQDHEADDEQNHVAVDDQWAETDAHTAETVMIIDDPETETMTDDQEIGAILAEVNESEIWNGCINICES